MARGLLNDRRELEALFDELADELARLGASLDVVMVGGSWMLWHSRRASTRDVDSARRFDEDLSGAVDRVGARHDLRSGWLNDSAASFWPARSSTSAARWWSARLSFHQSRRSGRRVHARVSARARGRVPGRLHRRCRPRRALAVAPRSTAEAQSDVPFWRVGRALHCEISWARSGASLIGT